MNRKIIIDANFPNETRVVLLDDNNQIEEIEYETANKQQNKGNIYLATISRIEPSLQAVFIEYGNEKKGFLPFIEIDPGYYDSNIDQNKPLSHLQTISLPVLDNDDLEQKISSTSDVFEVEDKNFMELDLEAYDSDIEPIDSNNDGTILKAETIEQTLKVGQFLLVQLVKEERGNKGAGFTTYISLAGKYCVLMPNKAMQNGISRKISQINERKRLKNIISVLLQYTNPQSASIIARTAAMGHSLSDFKKDYNYLVHLWNKILSVAETANIPSFIHQEEGIIQKVIRDMFNRNVSELLIQGSNAYQNAIKYTSDISPAKLNKINDYKNKTPIFTKYNIEEQLIKLYHPIVNLTSGGYIVINPTEALISIDVNSGRSTSEKNIEETAVKTNLEAAKEIAKQLKLRDLSGLIVVDFIDMQENKNKKFIEKSFKEFLSRDKAKIQVAGISTLGLLEMSRQRMRPSFLEANSTMCSHCSGKGVVRADESNAMLILRTIENEIFDAHKIDIVNIYANNNAVIYLLNNKREEISYIEDKYKIKLNFFIDQAATSDSYSLEKIRSSHKRVEQLSPLITPEVDLQHIALETTKHNKPSRKKWKTNNKKNKHSEAIQNKETTVINEDVSSDNFYRERKEEEARDISALDMQRSKDITNLKVIHYSEPEIINEKLPMLMPANGDISMTDGKENSDDNMTTPANNYDRKRRYIRKKMHKRKTKNNIKST